MEWLLGAVVMFFLQRMGDIAGVRSQRAKGWVHAGWVHAGWVTPRPDL